VNLNQYLQILVDNKSSTFLTADVASGVESHPRLVLLTFYIR
jgi:hypothetical protein